MTHGELLDIRTAAQRLGVAPATLRRLEACHRLVVPRLPGGRRRYTPDLLRQMARLLYGEDVAALFAPPERRA